MRSRRKTLGRPSRLQGAECARESAMGRRQGKNESNGLRVVRGNELFGLVEGRMMVERDIVVSGQHLPGLVVDWFRGGIANRDCEALVGMEQQVVGVVPCQRFSVGRREAREVRLQSDM